MKIDEKKLLRLTNQVCGKTKVVIKCKFNYKSEEYICVKRISDSETSEYGPYFFMRIQEDSKGQIECEYVKEPSLIYELMTEVAVLLSIEDMVALEGKKESKGGEKQDGNGQYEALGQGEV